MNRNELIEKAKRFWERPEVPGNWDTLFATMADFVLSLEAKDEWPQKNDEIWILSEGSYYPDRWDNPDLGQTLYVRGNIFRTEEEADLADRQRIARTAIHRWIEENAEKVDWGDSLSVKYFPMWNKITQEWVQDSWSNLRIPGWFHVYEKDYDRLMSENAEHFDVLKEGE